MIEKEIYLDAASLEGSDLEYYLSIDDLKNVAKPIVDKALSCIDRALEGAMLKKEDIDLIILAGGSSQLAGVYEGIKNKMGIAPHFISKDLMLAVSYGAALYQRDLAMYPSLKQNVKIAGQTIGLTVNDNGRRDFVELVQPRCELPYITEIKVPVDENQTTATIELKVKNNAGETTTLKSRKIKLQNGMSQVGITFEMTENRTIHLTAFDPKDRSNQISYEVESSELTGEELKKRQKTLGIQLVNKVVSNQDIPPFIGIDLGTTTSEITYVARTGDIRSNLNVIENPDDLPKEYAKYCFPSMIYFPSDNLNEAEVSNKKAIDQSTNKYAKFIENFKIADRDKAVMGVGKEQLSVSDLNSMVLSKIWNAAQNYFSAIKLDTAVITVPANFNADQCQDTVNAAKLAGIENVSLIDEPTAAYIYYKMLENIDDNNIRKVLVFDFGGGTTDVSILDIKSGIENGIAHKDSMYKVLSFDGDIKCGGKHVDEHLLKHVIKCFEDECGEKFDTNMTNELKSIIEKAKVELSLEYNEIGEF